MDLLSILATVILATTIATVLIGVAAYAAFKLREKRAPKGGKVLGVNVGDQGPIFFTRYVPQAQSSEAESEEIAA
jgi:hypothetical protein